VAARPERTTLSYSGPPIPRAVEAALAGAFTLEADRQAVTKLCRLSRGEESYPAALGTRFAVPQLCVRQDGNPTLFDPDCLEYEWALVGRGATLSPPEFSIDSGPTQTAEMDVTREGRFATRFISELHRQLSFNDLHGPRNELELVGWLDRAFVHKDLSQAQTSAFLVRAVQALQTERGYSLAQLVASRFRLRDAVEDKIARYRREAKQRAIQGVLFDEPTSSVEVSPAVAFTFPLTQYPAPRLHGRDIGFSKHYYARPAEMNADEEACALHIDQLREVKHWVRNLTREDYAFWLPTSSDKFYPDFVAELWDGRYVVVEFKNERDWTNDDSKEKRAVAELWAGRSGGRCLFVMPRGRDWSAITAALAVRD
jgi:type III restriction enzyme